MSNSKELSNDHSMTLSSPINRGLREGALIVFGAIALFLILALITYHSSDPGWSHTSQVNKIINFGGIAGAWFADLFLSLFGFLAYLFPVMVMVVGWILFRGRVATKRLSPHQIVIRASGFVLTLCAGTGLFTLHLTQNFVLPLNSGGILGDLVGHTLVGYFNLLGASLVLLALFLSGITFFTNLSWFRLADAVGRLTLLLIAWLKEKRYTYKENAMARQARVQRIKIVETKKDVPKIAPRIKPMLPKPKQSDRSDRERQIPLFEASSTSGLPPLSLLDPAEVSKNTVSKEALEVISRQLEIRLREYGVEIQVVAVHPGPVITRYELQPAAGVKVSQITNLAKDIARSLSVISVRVVEVIPGKPTIGVEIPNEFREIVRLSEVLHTKEYDAAKSPLTIALGKDIGGQPVIVDATKMPHLLVAGTTGSGKSVAINAMILSLLYKSNMQDVRMIMIDPKMLELSIYEGIPHLLAPVVTDMKEAANALRWCVSEMDKRYKLMSTLGVRNIGGYNRKVSDAIANKTPLEDPLFKPIEGVSDKRTLEPLPFIVVIVDELADMMMMVGKKVEELIARLAQKARAAGIHLILATQRPSVDVLTGLIKANIPTRMAFQVSSKIDSRTILDQMGAEQLLGHGDMLYLPPGTGVPVRVHGAFVADHEVHKVVENLKQLGEPEYIQEILDGSAEIDIPLAGEVDSNSECDPLYDEAVRIITETRRASISGIQRRLKIGYNRAARMVEEMERVGIVGPLESNGVREILVGPPPDID